ncbi:MAG: hypothetical protein WC966_00135 [Bradymonadales bacterium]
MKNYLIIAVFAVLCVTACSTSKKTQKTDSLQAKIQSEELAPVDESLEELDEENLAAKKDYEDLKSLVLNRIDLTASHGEGSGRIEIVINNNNVIMLNGTAMSKNTASNYLERELPALCTPNPSIKVEEQADYEIASWILEKIYSLGCTNVDLL